MSRRTPKNFSLYRVTHSTVPEIEVGKLLVDKGNRLLVVWDFISNTGDDMTSATGKRVGRLCVACRTEHRRVAPLGHDGPHGPDAPIARPDDEEESR